MIMPKKRKVGVRLDYTKQFNQMQNDLRGSPRQQKIEYYKTFYKSIAKAADARLLALERLSGKDNYENVREWAYKQAMYDIHSSFGPKAKRFNRKIPDDLTKIYKNIRNVLSFLESPTSSKQGIDEIYQKRAETIYKRYGIKTNWQSIAGLFESKVYQKTDSKYGSKTALKALGFIQRNTGTILKALAEGKSISVRLGANLSTTEEDKKHVDIISTEKYDSEVERRINNYLQYYKKDINTLFKGF